MTENQAAAYKHPAGHCQSVQCAVCWNLTDPTKPLRRGGMCRCGHPAEGGDLCRKCRGDDRPLP